MFSEIEIAGLVAFGVAIISLSIAFEKGAKWEKNNPDKLGFKWGYFFIFNTLLGHGLLLASLLLAFLFLGLGAIDEGRADELLIVGTLFAALIFISTKALKRRKWALVLLTLLSLNLLLIMINIIYLRNRCAEFSEGQPQLPRFLKRWRLAFFGSLVWILVIATFTILFQPYGRMYGGDFLHMLSVMMFTLLLALALLWIYDKFVR